MKNKKLSVMHTSAATSPHSRGEERPFPNRSASLLSGLSYQSDLMREPWPQQEPIPEEALQFMHLPLTERERQMRAAAFFKARLPN